MAMKDYFYEDLCPKCAGLISINIKYDYMPKWYFNKDGSLDRDFKCPWCESILCLGSDAQICMIRQGNYNNRISHKDLIVLDCDLLSVLICKLLYNQVHAKNGNQYHIGGNFTSEKDVMQWSANLLSPIFKTNKLIRLPVLES